MVVKRIPAAGAALLTSGLLCRHACAEPTIELSGAGALGVLAVGVTPARLAVSPSGSMSVRGERAFFVTRDTVSFLGVNGGLFGVDNETTVGGGVFF